MAIFATYKALQRLEKLHNEPRQDGGSSRKPSSAIAIPAWVRDGLWLALETYMVKPQQPGVTDKKQTISFKRALNTEWKIYRRWFEVKSHMADNEVESMETGHLVLQSIAKLCLLIKVT